MINLYNLSRFTIAHQKSYETALSEIKNGRKETHWMWYIFPQIHSLGESVTAQRYAIQSEGEAIAFLNDPYLGANLREISEELLLLDTDNPMLVFGSPDHLKLRSSMTLFAKVSEPDNVFQKVLDKYYGGKPDTLTLAILKE